MELCFFYAKQSKNEMASLIPSMEKSGQGILETRNEGVKHIPNTDANQMGLNLTICGLFYWRI